MLRALLFVLLLANVGFYAWTQGGLSPWLQPPGAGREPERLAAQHRPERIQVLSPGAASAAVAVAVASAAAAGSAPGAAAAAAADSATASAAPEAGPATLCLEAGPFTEAAARAALALLAEHGVSEGALTREVVARNHTWGVVIGRLRDRDALRARAEELKRMNIRFEEISFPPALAPSLRLGNFSDRYGAETAQAQLAGKGVRDARVVPLPLGATQQWLRAAKADAELQTRLHGLPPERLPQGFKPCVVRPSPPAAG